MPWIFFENFCSEFFKTTLQEVYNMSRGFLFSHSPVEKRILYSCHRNLLQIGNVDQELSLLVNKLTILRRKIIQRSIFFESDLFSSYGFFTYSRCTPIHCNGVMERGIRHQQKLKKCFEKSVSVGINCKFFSYYKSDVLKVKICVSFSFQYIYTATQWNDVYSVFMFPWIWIEPQINDFTVSNIIFFKCQIPLSF